MQINTGTCSPCIPSAKMGPDTQTCLRKHLPDRPRNKAISTGILTVEGGVLQEEEWSFEQKIMLLPTATAAIPVCFHLSVESRNSLKWQGWETRERGRERGRQTVRQTEAERVRDGHVRFLAPQLAPLRTNTDPVMNRSGFSVSSCCSHEVWLCVAAFTVEQRQPSQ